MVPKNYGGSRFCPINWGFEIGRGVFEKNFHFVEFCSVFVRENRTVLPIHPERKDKRTINTNGIFKFALQNRLTIENKRLTRR
jgi:hypothetical protein